MNISPNDSNFKPQRAFLFEDLEVIECSPEVRQYITSIYREEHKLELALRSVNLALTAPIFSIPSRRRSRQYLELIHEKEIITAYLDCLRGIH